MLNSKTKYALHALANLAQHDRPEPVLIADLAREERIPKKFLERILLDLKTHGFLQSRMGKGGGYLLRRKPEEISLGEVIRLMDGPLAPVSCVSETAYARCRDCTEEEGCCIRSVMKEVRDAIAGILDRTSLADMVKRSEDGARKKKLVLMYEI